MDSMLSLIRVMSDKDKEAKQARTAFTSSLASAILRKTENATQKFSWKEKRLLVQVIVKGEDRSLEWKLAAADEVRLYMRDIERTLKEKGYEVETTVSVNHKEKKDGTGR